MHFSIGFSYRFGGPGTIKIDGLRRVLAGFWGSWEGSWNDFLNDFFINCCPHASGRHLGPFWCHFEGFGQGRGSQGPSKLMVCGGLWQDFGELGREQSQGPSKLMVCGGLWLDFGELWIVATRFLRFLQGILEGKIEPTSQTNRWKLGSQSRLEKSSIDRAKTVTGVCHGEEDQTESDICVWA